MYHYFECEHGVVIPSLEELIAIADVLDCPAGWLIGTKEEREAFASGDRKVIGKVKAPWE